MRRPILLQDSDGYFWVNWLGEDIFIGDVEDKDLWMDALRMDEGEYDESL